MAAAIFALALAAPVAEAQWKTAVLPVVGSSPQVGEQFGLAVLRTRQLDDSLQTRPSSFIANVVTATEGHRQVFVGSDRWTAGNRQRLQLAAFAATFSLPVATVPGYFTQNVNVPSQHSTLTVGATKSWKSGAASWRYLGFGLAGSGTSDSVFIPPCDTVTCPPPLGVCDCGVAFRFSSYQVVQGSVGWVRDTRDNVFAPTRGRVIDASFSLGYRWDPGFFAQRKRHGGIRLDWREYRPLADAGTLATRVVVSDAIGFLPLGSLNQHSVNDGQAFEPDFMEAAILSRIEWRSPPFLVSNRLGLATFVDLSVPLNNGPAGVLGGGLRYRLDPRTRSTIRVDFAVGPLVGQRNLYVGFNESF